MGGEHSRYAVEWRDAGEAEMPDQRIVSDGENEPESRIGDLRTPKRDTGGLNAWQVRVAKEMIEAHLDGRIALEELAAVCGLSASRFAHAFKSSTGVAPHQWLLQRRIERSKVLLKHSAERMADIAQSCGFADQSHFTRVFKRAVGASPGEWKRALDS